MKYGAGNGRELPATAVRRDVQRWTNQQPRRPRRRAGLAARLFLRHGLIVVAVGIACRVVTAMAAARSLASLVFGITVTDPATLGTVATLLTVVTLLACYMPARSATRVDPLQALRSE